MNRVAWLLVAASAFGARAEPLEQALRRLDDAAYETRAAGLVNDPLVAEISGFAASRLDPQRLYAINDSDNGHAVHALDANGRRIATYPVDDAINYDWEDLAAYEDQGQRFLVIADTGDNGGLRRYIELLAVHEPDPAAPVSTLPVVWRMRVIWPDGPRDCEALAIDVGAREMLLISKKRVPAQVFRVPLPEVGARGPRRAVAEQIAVISGIPQPTEDDLAAAPPGVRFMSQITGADLSPDGLRLAIVTYREAYLLTRARGEAWREALVREPQRLRMPPLVQAEAIAFDRDGRTIWIGTEKLPAPLIRADPR